ncbi:hypothetical protein [Terrisporobacter sp.]
MYGIWSMHLPHSKIGSQRECSNLHLDDEMVFNLNAMSLADACRRAGVKYDLNVGNYVDHTTCFSDFVRVVAGDVLK